MSEITKDEGEKDSNYWLDIELNNYTKSLTEDVKKELIVLLNAISNEKCHRDVLPDERGFNNRRKFGFDIKNSFKNLDELINCERRSGIRNGIIKSLKKISAQEIINTFNKYCARGYLSNKSMYYWIITKNGMVFWIDEHGYEIDYSNPKNNNESYKDFCNEQKYRGHHGLEFVFYREDHSIESKTTNAWFWGCLTKKELESVDNSKFKISFDVNFYKLNDKQCCNYEDLNKHRNIPHGKMYKSNWVKNKMIRLDTLPKKGFIKCWLDEENYKLLCSIRDPMQWGDLGLPPFSHVDVWQEPLEYSDDRCYTCVYVDEITNNLKESLEKIVSDKIEESQFKQQLFELCKDKNLYNTIIENCYFECIDAELGDPNNYIKNYTYMFHRKNETAN